MDCDGQTQGCTGGGSVPSAFDYAEKSAIELGSDYPYIGNGGACHADAKLGKVKVQSYK